MMLRLWIYRFLKDDKLMRANISNMYNTISNNNKEKGKLVNNKTWSNNLLKNYLSDKIRMKEKFMKNNLELNEKLHLNHMKSLIL
jgi:hypothetical protein